MDDDGVHKFHCIQCGRFIAEVEVVRGLDVKMYFLIKCPNRRCKLHKSKDVNEFELEFDEIFFEEEAESKKK